MREDPVQEEAICRRAVGLYALYRLHNGLRHGSFRPSEIQDAFGRYLAEARSSRDDSG